MAKPRSVLLPTLLAVGFASCSKPTISEPKNVFGIDQREDITSNDYPWSTIGRLDSGCTGTLVGRRLVLTAAHCIVDSTTKVIKSQVTYFRPAFKNGTSAETDWIDYIWYGTDSPEADRGKDWAILRLTTTPGDTYKWMDVGTVDFASQLPYSTNLAGYSSDRNNGNTASVHRGCYVMSVVGDRLLNDCDSKSGVSGGPLFNVINGVPTIVAVAVSEYRQGASDSIDTDHYSADVANVAISASSIVNDITTLRSTIDAGIAAPPLSGALEALNPNVPGTPSVPPNLPDPGGSDGNPPLPPPTMPTNPSMGLDQMAAIAQQLLADAQALSSFAEARNIPQVDQAAIDLIGAAQKLAGLMQVMRTPGQAPNNVQELIVGCIGQIESDANFIEGFSGQNPGLFAAGGVLGAVTDIGKDSVALSTWSGAGS